MATATKEQLPLTPVQADLVASCFKFARLIGSRIGERAGATPEEIEDLQSAACQGLLNAARKFDPARGFAFTTFCYRPCVHYALSELDRQERHGRRFAVASQLQDDTGESPCWMSQWPDDLAEPLLEQVERSERLALISEAFKALEKARPRHAKALRLRLQGLRLRQVGAALGTGHQRAHQLEADALDFVRQTVVDLKLKRKSKRTAHASH